MRWVPFVVVLAAGGVAWVQSAAAQQTARTPAVIEVTGSAIVTIMPDRATVPVTVQTTDETSLSATLRHEQDIASLMALIKELGIPEKDVQLAPVRVVAKTRPVPAAANAKPGEVPAARQREPDGFEASTFVRVHFQDLDLATRFANAARDKPGANLGSIMYTVADLVAGANKARKAALDVARRKAEGAAEAAGLKLGRLVRITVPPTGLMTLAASIGHRPDGPLSDDEVRLSAEIPKGVKATDVRAIMNVSWEAE